PPAVEDKKAEDKAGAGVEAPPPEASPAAPAAVLAAAAPEADPEALLNEGDCAKCHDAEPAAIEANGGRHKTAVTCLECHPEHLPLGVDTVPECAMCHGGSGHYELDNCLGCHANPHSPLLIEPEDSPETTAGCLSCHGEKGEEFRTKPTRHAEQNCTLCHPGRHKTILDCLSCHEPHAQGQVYEECLVCHQPHSPRPVTYQDDTPSAVCGGCHGEIFQRLSKDTSKHAGLVCAYCHRREHRVIPSCGACHTKPHPDSLLERFPDCLQCHQDPHDLVV
ncbi:MAG: cytochrome c3 family protein, partial [Thermodesulfobacteriota bacterium]